MNRQGKWIEDTLKSSLGPIKGLTFRRIKRDSVPNRNGVWWIQLELDDTVRFEIQGRHQESGAAVPTALICYNEWGGLGATDDIFEVSSLKAAIALIKQRTLREL